MLVGYIICCIAYKIEGKYFWYCRQIQKQFGVYELCYKMEKNYKYILATWCTRNSVPDFFRLTYYCREGIMLIINRTTYLAFVHFPLRHLPGFFNNISPILYFTILFHVLISLLWYSMDFTLAKKEAIGCRTIFILAKLMKS